MNGYHAGLLRAYIRRAGGPRSVRWQMYGDQGPGWKSADIELNMTSVTEVRYSTAVVVPTANIYTGCVRIITRQQIVVDILVFLC